MGIGYAVGMGLSTAMAYMNAHTARTTAVFVFLFVLPVFLVAFGSLRFEMVRLVLREDNAVFFCVINVLTNTFYGIVFGDARTLISIANTLGWINVVCIDAILRGIRRFTLFTAIGLAGVLSWTLCLLLNMVDEPHGTSLWQYEDGANVYDVSAVDYVVNGSSTFIILLAKIIYRKRKSIPSSTRNTMIECVVLRCQTKLAPCSPQLADLRTWIQAGSRGRSSSRQLSANHLQQLQFVRSGKLYDARKIVFPVSISSTRPLPRWFTRLLYVLGCGGFGLLMPSSYLINTPRSNSIPNRNGIATTESVTTVGAFVCSLSFWMIFIACYQRTLLKLLFTSFDFVFYSAQAIVTQLSAASMYDWELNYCLWLASSWIWMQWVFCLDALTPMMKTKLRFRVRYAIPVTLALLIGQAIVLLCILVVGMNPPQGHVIWSSEVGGRVVTVRVLPFFVTRLFISGSWTLRILLRLCKSSDSDAIILRGAVRYENYLSVASVRSKKRTQSVSAKSSFQPVNPSAR